MPHCHRDLAIAAINGVLRHEATANIRFQHLSVGRASPKSGTLIPLEELIAALRSTGTTIHSFFVQAPPQ